MENNLITAFSILTAINIIFSLWLYFDTNKTKQQNEQVIKRMVAKIDHITKDAFEERSILLYEVINLKIKEALENEDYRTVHLYKEALKKQRFKELYEPNIKQ